MNVITIHKRLFQISSVHSAKHLGDLLCRDQRQIRGDLVTFLGGESHRLVVLRGAVGRLGEHGARYLREQRQLVQLPPRRHGALLRLRLVLVVNGLREARGGIHHAGATDHGDDGGGLGGDLLDVGRNVAVDLGDGLVDLQA